MSEFTPSPDATGQPQLPPRPGSPHPPTPPSGHTTSAASLPAPVVIRPDCESPQAPHPHSAEATPGEEGDLPHFRQRQSKRGRSLTHKDNSLPASLTPEQRLLLLDTWRRSGLPAGDFAALVGISKHTLYAWKRKFEIEGPAGLDDKPRGGPKGRGNDRTPRLTVTSRCSFVLYLLFCRGQLARPRRQISFIIPQGLCARAIDWDFTHFLMLC